MPPGSSKQAAKQKPSDIAAETKRHITPYIKANYEPTWPTSSYLFPHPIVQCAQRLEETRPSSLGPPQFYVQSGDPVDTALRWATAKGAMIPVICAANDKRPGGDWETGVQGYEERLCRRSTLAGCLGTPAPNATTPSNFPIPSAGGIYSSHVVVFRGPQYQKREFEEWAALPVISVPPTRWPKLDPSGSKYSFSDERAMVKDKIRGALRIAAYWGHDTVVVAGDWGLGNGHRNPPRELAELWREVLLYDPELRGRVREAAFVFEDPGLCTAQLILAEMSKKDHKRGDSAKGKGKAAAAGGYLPDAEVYQQVFDNEEIRRVLQQPDARYGLDNLLTK